MSSDPVDAIVRTLLYEGYLLYPYRPSAVKNRQRFNFGVLYPQSYCQNGDTWQLRVECPLLGGAETRLRITVRFLQLVERSAENQPDEIWHQAFEREVPLWDGPLGPLLEQTARATFGLAPDRGAGDDGTDVGGTTTRGEARLAVDAIRGEVHRLTVQVSNLTGDCPAGVSRDAALLQSLVSTHVVLRCAGGSLISLLDPPEELRDVAGSCVNVGVWPVMIGEPGSGGCMLASPIILYDYPQVAAESAGDLFDGTEIDEILALRILTMTEEEKREARGADERAREILDRTERLPPEHWAKLHGAIRGLRPATRSRS